jgi:D-alanyl-D-alanine carboxypeptidase
VLAGSGGKDFMVPYPASVLKVMVAYGVLRLVDQDRIELDSR